MVFRRWFLALAVAAAFAPQVARADTVTLKNGREIHGRLIEELPKSIRMRTEGGTITIEKAEIASFTEGEVFTNYGGRTRTQDEVDGSKPGTTPTPSTPGQPGQPTPPTGGGRTTGPADSAGEWKWPANLSAAEIATLAPIRDQALADLEKLGLTPEERLKAVVVSGEERARIQELMLRFNYRQRQGSANAHRNQARDRVLEFGLKSLPFLADGLVHEAQWTRRVSAQGLERLAKTPPAAPAPPPQAQGAPPPRGQPAPTPPAALTGDDVRWLMYHHEVPERLLALLDNQGEIDSPFIRAEAATALAAVTGGPVAWPATPTEERLRTADENRAKAAWETWWTREKARFNSEQEAKAKSREELQAKLAALREGRNPDATEPAPR